MAGRQSSYKIASQIVDLEALSISCQSDSEMAEPLATHDFADGGLDAAITFFRRTRNELRTLRLVRVSTDWVRLFDINGDFFELRGLGYADPEIVHVLKSFDTPFNPESIHDPIAAPYKEFKTGRRYPWAADRVM